MGWRCRGCGNTEEFIEINKVETIVYQDKKTTRIEKVLNKYLDEPLIEVYCAKCDYLDIEWIDVPDQDDAYLFNDKNYISAQHNVKAIVLELTDSLTEPENITDFDIITEVIGGSNDLSYLELGGGMGNPMLHPSFHEILKFSVKKGFKVNIVSIISKIDEIEKIDPKNIEFSIILDHPEKEKNDALMGKGIFENSNKAFSILNKKKIPFTIIMRIGKDNFEKLEEMQLFSKKVGARELVPIELFPLEEERCMVDEMKKKVLEDIGRLRLRRSIHFSPVLKDNGCTYQRRERLFIDAKGMISYCHFLSRIPNSFIEPAEKLSFLEMIQRNNEERNKFLEKKEKGFDEWKKPRETSSPCSYCLHSFGLEKKW